MVFVLLLLFLYQSNYFHFDLSASFKTFMICWCHVQPLDGTMRHTITYTWWIYWYLLLCY